MDKSQPLKGLAALIVMICLLLTATALTAESLAPPAYEVQPGDVLDISVWKDDYLQREVIVRPDGGLTFPLIGEIQANGKSVENLRVEIVEKLTRYIPDPVVTVAVRQLNGNKVFVIGKVNRPGEFPATSYIDVVQALSMAGGMTPYAAANKIQILRRVNGKMVAIPFRYGDIEKGQDLQQNIVLQSRDVVLVP